MLKILSLLSAAENRESFFRRIALFYPKSDHRYIEIERAYNYAKDAFRGVEREGGERYFEHLRAVAIIMIDYLRVKDYRLIIVALLHDIVEDKPEWTIDRVRQEFGEYVAWLIDYISKPPAADYVSKQERDHAYHYRFRSAPRELFLVKLPDRLHNIITLGACPPEKRKRKVEETINHYLPYAEDQFILYHELCDALENVEIFEQ